MIFDFAGDAAGYRIAAIRADGSDFHVLGFDGFLPSASADGATLLYVTGSPEADESLVVRNLASGQTHTVAHVSVQPPSAGLGKAAISPDGKWIAYGDSPHLRLVKADGSDDSLLVAGPYDAGCCPWSYGHPQFSADSALIYFSTIGTLESIRTDGSGLAMLYQDQFFSGNGAYPGFVFPNVSLSPDGKKIVADVACDASELRVFDAPTAPFDPCATGTKLVETGYAEASNESSNPSWGPTNLIAYDDAKDIYSIDPSGGTKTNLTASQTATDGAFAADPVWAPGCATLP